jgi:hypothetical protein
MIPMQKHTFFFAMYAKTALFSVISFTWLSVKSAYFLSEIIGTIFQKIISAERPGSDDFNHSKFIIKPLN